MPILALILEKGLAILGIGSEHKGTLQNWVFEDCWIQER